MSFNTIYGHTDNKEKFKKILENDLVSQSYIFKGEEGIGKKFFAINVAKALLCKKLKNNSCDECISCRKFINFNHPDIRIIEPDGKSIKNYQIKEFKNFLKFKPNESDNKIIIINDSEKLTISAQNTILKVLEEPPKYALIIFITNNINVLLDTVKSRSQIIRFDKLKVNEMIDFLEYKYGAKKNEAELLSVFSNGIVNKAVMALESGEFLDLREKIINYSNSLLFNDKINAIKGIKFLNKEKDNINLIFDIMINWFRDIIIVQNTNNTRNIVNKDKNDIIKKNAYKLIDKNIVRIIDLIHNAKSLLRKNVNYKLVIDDLILKIIKVRRQ